MRKVIATITMAALLVLGWSTGSSAADTRYFQYSGPDTKNTTPGNKPVYDITEFQQAVTSDAEFQYYIVTKSALSPDVAKPPISFEVLLDVDLDNVADYSLETADISVPQGTSTLAKAWDNNGAFQLEDCDAWTWITTSGDALGFSAPVSCFEGIGSYVNVQVRILGADGVLDQQPEGDSFVKFKTSWIAGQTCNASKSKTKKTYNGKTYICVQKSGKWSYQPYANYALSLTKYLTERAYYACGLEGVYGAELQDNGKTLLIDSAYKYGLNDSQFTCVQRYLAMPSSVKNHIGMTRALDGIQKDSWTHMSAFWNYHPDSGLDITFTYH